MAKAGRQNAIGWISRITSKVASTLPDQAITWQGFVATDFHAIAQAARLFPVRHDAPPQLGFSRDLDRIVVSPAKIRYSMTSLMTT